MKIELGLGNTANQVELTEHEIRMAVCEFVEKRLTEVKIQRNETAQLTVGCITFEMDNQLTAIVNV